MNKHMFGIMVTAMFVLALGVGCGWTSNAKSNGTILLNGSGRVVTESRPVSGFNGLVVNSMGRVSIEQTGVESLSISADDNLLPSIVTEVRGGKLVIELKPGVSLNRTNDLTFRMTVKLLDSIELNGTAMIEAKNVDSDQMVSNIAGAGKVQLYGKIDEQQVTISGTGGYNAENVQCKSATVTNSGAGIVVLRVSDQLNATSTGVGVIEYIGTPQVTRNVTGMGFVRQR